jgi:alanyl-tRNA synthetase
VLALDPERIWISVFGGGQVAGAYVGEDRQTWLAWQKLGVDRAHLVRLGPEANYWMQGGGIDGSEPKRKAGANTEMFYDRGSPYACSPHCGPGCRCGRFVEFANSLFITHQVTEDHRLEPLQDPFVETVIGSERVAMLQQGADSIFETEPFRSLIAEVRSYAQPDGLPADMVAVSERVIVDYVRALVALVGDGAPPPGKNGRERIIKLLIRGIVTRMRLLQIDERRALPALLAQVGAALDPVAPNQNAVSQALAYSAAESERFERTLARGQRQLEALLVERAYRSLSGRDMVELEKRWGMPTPLIAASLLRKQLPFSMPEYRAALKTWQAGEG